MKPNFLVIGAHRCATTYLHGLLDQHPRVYMPSRRKEIHYFDHFYAEGPDWYAQFFPESGDAYEAVGEASPNYIFDPEVPARIHRFDPHMRLILSVRDPVERLWSTYEQRRRILGYAESFETFIEEDPVAVDRGLYSIQFDRYTTLFDRAQIHVLLFEDLTSEPRGELERIRGFLELNDPFEIDPEVLGQKANAKFEVRFPTAYRLARQCGQFLSRRLNQDWIVNAVKQSGVLRVFEQGEATRSMSASARERLQGTYREDVERFGEDLGLDLLTRWNFR